MPDPAGGDDIGDDEPDPVRAHTRELAAGAACFRVPHVTETVRYDGASPYNHFSDWNGRLEIQPARAGGHPPREDG